MILSIVNLQHEIYAILFTICIYLFNYSDSLFRSCQFVSNNVSKRTAVIFARAGRRFPPPRPVTLFGEQIEWVDTTRYLGGNPRYTTNLYASHRSGEEEDCAKDGYAGSPLEKEE